MPDVHEFLRNLALVLAVAAAVRPSGSTILPVGAEVLQAGDLLAQAGTPVAVARAKLLLRIGRVQEPADADLSP
jgi:hypothetical protein